ncbi:pentapeptide repeat-containing protein [Staphylococcus phage vB_SauM-HM01]|nr:pentapeptide repeat-containing protein [Staphylococcus phage vB_SauM-HM01]
MKTITKEELNKALEEHKLWIESNEEEGKRADLSFTDLCDLDLNDVDLREATLIGADLSYVDLTEADLRYADLSCAKLIEVNLTEDTLIGANLSQASLQGIRGLEMYSIDNIGSFKGKVTYLPKYNKVFVGCWEGNLEEFLKKGLEMNEGDNKERTNIVLAYQFFKNQL